MIPQMRVVAETPKAPRVSGFGMRSRASGRWLMEEQVNSPDKPLLKKELNAVPERHRSCTEQGCRTSTGWV